MGAKKKKCLSKFHTSTALKQHQQQHDVKFVQTFSLHIILWQPSQNCGSASQMAQQLKHCKNLAFKDTVRQTSQSRNLVYLCMCVYVLTHCFVSVATQGANYHINKGLVCVQCVRERETKFTRLFTEL